MVNSFKVFEATVCIQETTQQINSLYQTASSWALRMKYHYKEADVLFALAPHFGDLVSPSHTNKL